MKLPAAENWLARAALTSLTDLLAGCATPNDGTAELAAH
jgi:hypothetical protein